MKTSPHVNARAPRKFLFTAAGALLFFSVLGAQLAVAEYAMRFSKKFANYYEINAEDWDPGKTKDVLAEPWLWINPRNKTRVVEKKEYRQVFHFGPDGLPGEPPPLQKEKDEYRIIVVGDSFVQGFGDTENLGVVGRLKKLVDKNSGAKRPVRLMNAGIGGSDPVFERELIARELLRYKPDLILLAINSTDVQDLKRRGGLDRFTPDGQLKRTTPWWTWIYNRSHLFRAFVSGVLGYDTDLTPMSEHGAREQAAADGIVKAISAIDKLAEQNSFKLVVLLHPLQPELKAGHLAAPLLNVREQLAETGIDAIDLTNRFRESIPIHSEANYFWEKDGHYNPKGYDVFASAVEAELRDGVLKSRVSH